MRKTTRGRIIQYVTLFNERLKKIVTRPIAHDSKRHNPDNAKLIGGHLRVVKTIHKADDIIHLDKPIILLEGLRVTWNKDNWYIGRNIKLSRTETVSPKMRKLRDKLENLNLNIN